MKCAITRCFLRPGNIQTLPELDDQVQHYMPEHILAADQEVSRVFMGENRVTQKTLYGDGSKPIITIFGRINIH